MINYIQRTRAYYKALGYPAYQWASHPQDTFTPLAMPLAQAKLGLVTTAAPFVPDLGDQGPGARYNAAAKFFEVFTASVTPPPDLRISHIAYDRAHCQAKDANGWLPITALQQAKDASLIGELAPRLVGAPTNRSQRVTITQDAPAVLAACRTLAVDAVLLVPT